MRNGLTCLGWLLLAYRWTGPEFKFSRNSDREKDDSMKERRELVFCGDCSLEGRGEPTTTPWGARGAATSVMLPGKQL